MTSQLVQQTAVCSQSRFTYLNCQFEPLAEDNRSEPSDVVNKVRWSSIINIIKYSYRSLFDNQIEQLSLDTNMDA